MRWVFILLVIINLAILAWGLTDPDSSHLDLTSGDPEIGDLQIISPQELEQLKTSPLSAEEQDVWGPPSNR